ncbi:hypothetical protein BC941DRAFT_450833 [Chlamydoabsidia padenii]|nr:hypothetical protein BC941DRAFT_450833 [Chlamydoabsidia padenii]
MAYDGRVDLQASGSLVSSSTSSSASQDNLVLVVGGRVTVPSLDIIGTLRFVGKAQFKPGVWAGIELDTVGSGKNDGTVQGIRYFTCPDKSGLFVLASKVNPIPPPPKQQHRQGRERIKAHVRPVASKSARVSSKSSSATQQVPPLPNVPTATKRSITTRLPNNKTSISTRTPNARASASPVIRRPSTSPIRQQRASALPSVKRSITSSSSNTTNSSSPIDSSNNVSNKRASVVRISVSNPVVHVFDSVKTESKPDIQDLRASPVALSSSPSVSSISSPHTQSTVATSTTSITMNSTSPTTKVSTSPSPPSPQSSSSPSPSALNQQKPMVDMEEMHQLYDLLQRTQREKDVLVEQMQNKDAAFERLVSAKESYALQVEDKDQAIARAQRQLTSQQSLIDELSEKVAGYEEKAAQQVRDDATEEQYVRRVSKLESLVATLQEQAVQTAQSHEQRTREHAGQLDLLRRELDQEKQLCASLEKECDALRKTGLETIHAYEQSLEQIKQDHTQLMGEKDARLRHTQSALDNLKRQLHTFDIDGGDIDDVDLIMATYNDTNSDQRGNSGYGNYDDDNLYNDDDNNSITNGDGDSLQLGRSSSHRHRLSSQQQQYNTDARSWSEQRHRLEDQLDLTMTELENERTTMRSLVTELETLRDEIKNLRRHQHGMETQYAALQQEMTKEIEDKRRLMEEADAAFEAQAKAEDELYQMKIALQQQSSTSSSAATIGDGDDNITTSATPQTSENLLQQQLRELEQQASHYKEQYHAMEQECMRLMDEMLAMADDSTNLDQKKTTRSSLSKNDTGSSNEQLVKSLEQQLKQANHDHEQDLLGKQIEIQKLGKELADLESLVETKVFGQGDVEEALEEERNKVKRLERQLAQLSSSATPPPFCEMCDEQGHDLLSCKGYKSRNGSSNKTTMYCDYCDAQGDHRTEDCPDQDETF